jgi:hypothetical protein
VVAARGRFGQRRDESQYLPDALFTVRRLGQAER